MASGTTTRQGAQPQLGVEDQQRDADPDEGDQRDQRGQHAVLDQRLELVDVGGHPGHDPAGHLALVVVERQPLQLGPDPDPQRQHDALGGPAGHERLADLVDHVGQGHHQVDARRGEQRPLRAGRHAAVDARLDQDRAGQRGQRVEDDQDAGRAAAAGGTRSAAGRRLNARVAARLGVQIDGWVRRAPAGARPPGAAAPGSAPGCRQPPPPRPRPGPDARRAEPGPR